MDTLYQQFFNPGSEYSPMPFWFWNDRLDKKKLKHQIEEMQDKGVEGFVLHPRIGIPEQTTYLSDKFMEYVAFAVEEAHKRNMHVILYDEAMYPSGAANGKVVEYNPSFASRGLAVKVMEQVNNHVKLSLEEEDRVVAVYVAVKDGEENISNVRPLQKQELEVTDEKVSIAEEVIDSHVRLQNGNKEGKIICLFLVESFTQGTIRGIHAGQDDGQKQAPRSADLLNPEAVQAFIEITHERYKEVVGKYFGNTIFAMFTDEPDITGRNSKPGYIAWTEGFENYLYREGLHVTDLPGLFFDIGEKTPIVKQTYEKALNKRMLETYYIPIADWCEENNLFLTGHPADSDDIGLLKPFTIPGQDVVWRWVAPEEKKGITGVHSTAGKCGSDAARHYQRRRNLNEYLGVCGIDNSWNLSASDMKWYTDWLAVRGVNLFCPHAFYYSIDGRERSHERPPDVGINNVWWRYYRYFSTYIKRISWLMTDSVNQAEVGILALNHYMPWKVARYFYEQQIEFNYVQEALFTEDLVKIKDGHLVIGQQAYRAIVLDELTVSLFAKKVLDQLTAFVLQGGKVYFVTGNLQKDEFPHAIYITPEDKELLDSSFSAYRYADIEGDSQSIRMTKLKKDDRIFYFITNEGDEPYYGKVNFYSDYPTTEWNPWTGKARLLSKEWKLNLLSRESIILCVEERNNLCPEAASEATDEINIHPALVVQKNNEKAWSREVLRDWSEYEELQYYSGTLDYQFTFSYHGDTLEEVVIDLGEVYEIAEVSLNQSKSEVKMWAPYHILLSGNLVHQGENILLVRITNNSANYMDQQLLPSGLIGPVKIKGIKRRK